MARKKKAAEAADNQPELGAAAAPAESAPVADAPAEDAPAADAPVSNDEAAPDPDPETGGEATASTPVAVASGVGRFRVLNAKAGLGAAGAEIRMANSRAASRIEAGEIERL